MLDEEVHPEPVAVRVADPGPAVPGGDDGQRSLARMGGRLPAQMLRDAADVLHEQVGTREDGVVDALRDVAHGQTRLVVGDQLRVVDVPGAIRLGADEVAQDGELGTDGPMVKGGHGWERLRLRACASRTRDPWAACGTRRPSPRRPRCTATDGASAR